MKLTALTIATGIVLFLTTPPKAPAKDNDTAERLVDALMRAPGVQPGHRPVHAKGVVCEGTFTPSADAKRISLAAHFQSEVSVTVRFSDGAEYDPMIPDTSPDATPRGIAIRFRTGAGTDIVAISHNGFLAGTGEEFLELLQAQAASDPSKPHPSPIETFLASHPAALKFVQDPKPMPVSFATESYFANNAFVFVDQKGHKQAGRYQIVPVHGPEYLSAAASQMVSPSYLFDEMPDRVAKGGAKFRLLLELPDPGDRTNDSSVVWPADRKKLELGTITIRTVVADSAAAEQELAFDPARLIKGIELSDDPLPALRSRAYALAVARRQQAAKKQ